MPYSPLPLPRIPRGLLMLLVGSLIGLAAGGSAELVVPSGVLRVEDSTIVVERNGHKIIRLESIHFNYVAPEAMRVVAASVDQLELELIYPANADFFHRSDDTKPRSVRLILSRHGNGFRLQADPVWANQVTMNFHPAGDHCFGLSSPLQPDNQHAPDLTGSQVLVEVTNEGENIVENYASAFSAFYMSSHGYGAFFDTFATGRYQFDLNGRTQIHHETGALDWYVFLGDDGAAIHRAYFDVIGAPKHVPLWALGPIGWRDQNDGGSAEIIADIKRFADLRMPLTGWFVDRPYSDGAHAWSHMNFSAKFADPADWIREIREEQGLEFMTWTATAFFGDTPLPRHLPGGFTYADLSDPATVTAFQRQLAEQQHRVGVKGHKMDRADEKFPDWENWADETVHRDARRNTYAYLFAKVHDEALRQTWGHDQFTFARAAIHRAQPYLSAIWGGDPRTSWAGLQGNTANAMRASFMGFPVWGTDVGGYIGAGLIDEDLYLRWLQFGTFSGLLEIKLDGAGGEGQDRMPWRYDASFQSRYRRILDQRMALLPTLYSLANHSAERGSMMQPLAYRHLSDPATYAIWDQFYLGDLMVAPILTAGTSREVYLPAGIWHEFDLDHGIQTTLAGAHTVVAQAELDQTPLFVRANSLLVTGEIYQGNSRVWKDPLEPNLVIHVFPGQPGETTTFDYVDPFDDNQLKTITLIREADQTMVTAPAIAATVTVLVHLSDRTNAFSYAPSTSIRAVFLD